MQSVTQTDCVDTLWLRAAILVSNLPSLTWGWVWNLLRARGTAWEEARKIFFSLLHPSPDCYMSPTLVPSVHLKSRWPSVKQSAPSRRSSCEQSIGRKENVLELWKLWTDYRLKRRSSTAYKRGCCVRWIFMTERKLKQTTLIGSFY